MIAEEHLRHETMEVAMAKMDLSVVVDEMGKEAGKMFNVNIVSIPVFISDEQQVNDIMIYTSLYVQHRKFTIFFIIGTLILILFLVSTSFILL